MTQKPCLKNNGMKEFCSLVKRECKGYLLISTQASCRRETIFYLIIAVVILNVLVIASEPKC